MNFQLAFQPFSSAYEDLTDPGNQFINYFRHLQLSNIESVVNRYYAGPGPKGYGTSLVLSRILKVKEVFLSDRDLAQRLRDNATYRAVCLMQQGQTPAHNTFHTLRSHLKVRGYREIHRNFVLQAHELGLLDATLPTLPRNRRPGLVLIADSTPLHAYCSTKGEKQEDGTWLFTDRSAAFGRPHPHYKYAVGHRSHTLFTATGVPLVSLIARNNWTDNYFIVPLLRLLRRGFPELEVAYVILDAGYDSEEIHRRLYEEFHVIAVILPKEAPKYDSSFTPEGVPCCPSGFTLQKRGIDYQRDRTKYCCMKVCQNNSVPNSQTTLSLPLDYEACLDLKRPGENGRVQYTYFRDGYRKFGPALPNTVIHQKLAPLRTSIERSFGLLKANRYRMEWMNTYMGFRNVSLHVLEHDIVLTQDIIFHFLTTGKIGEVIKT